MHYRENKNIAVYRKKDFFFKISFFFEDNLINNYF